MATNIEQIFRSFVVSKFREIQEQQFGSGKIGSQYNGEINTSGQVNSSDDTIHSIESLQNDSLVQKIEQVLSEVLGTEPQYKSGGEEIVRTISHSAKRGLSEEVQDEIPRKKSKKDKKHKDKKKKKKRKKEKKEKKYKKHDRETDIQQKECGDMPHVSHSSSLLSAEDDVDTPTLSAFKDFPWVKEKATYENLNSAMVDSHDSRKLDTDTSKLETSKDSALINIQKISEVSLSNDKELENDTYSPSNITVNVGTEDESLNITDAEGSASEGIEGALDIKEVEQAESLLEAKEHRNVPENSPYCITAEPANLENRTESDTVEVKSVNSVTEPVSLENMKQSVSASFETTGYKLMTLPLEANAEAKDSVTTLGFLAMVVGKDFEATSEFLNTAKVKASEKSPKHTDMKGDLVHDSEKMITIKNLQKPLQLESRTETAPEAEYAISERDFEPSMITQLTPQQIILKRSSEFNVEEYRTASLGAEALTSENELRETGTSPIMMELSELEKPSQQAIEKYAKDLKETVVLDNMNRTSSKERSSVVLMETKNLDVCSDFKEIEANYLKAKSECETESGNWKAVPELLRTTTTLESSQEFEKAEEINYLETALETVIENRRDSEITKQSEALINVNFPENVSQLKEVTDSGITLETEIVKTQNIESSKHVGLRNEENENWKKVPESLMTIKNTSELEFIEESKIVSGTSQSDMEAKKKEGEEEDRDMDASSESLHMIFTNYSEHSLELYTETGGVMELKNSETILESTHKLDANNFVSLCTKDTKDKESEAMSEVNELQEDIKSSHGQVKNVEAVSDSTALPVVKNMGTLEAISSRKKTDSDSHFAGEVEEERSDTSDFIKKNWTGAKPTDLRLLLSDEEVIKKDSKVENELIAKSQDSSISKPFPEIDLIRSEKIPESEGRAVVHDLNEGRRFMAAAIDPKEIFQLKNLASVEAKNDSTFVSTVKQFEEQNLELLGHTDTQIKKVHIDSGPACARPSSEMTFSDKFHIQEEKLEERTGTTGLIGASEPLHHSGRDLVIVPESDKIEVITDSVQNTESLILPETKSENTLKYFYKIQMKDSKTTAGPVDVKVLKTDSEPLLQAEVEIREDLSDCNSLIASEILEITTESPRKKILPESQCISGLKESDATFRIETLTHSHLKTAPADICVIDAENVIKNQEGTPASLLTTVESVDVLKESFEPIYTTDVNKVESNQKSLINLESLNKEKINDVHAQLFHENDAGISETFKSSHVKTQILEGILSTANKEKGGAITQASDAKLVLNYSEVSESTKTSERENSDISLTEFAVGTKDSEADSRVLHTGDTKSIKTVHTEKYSKPLSVLESKDVADVPQSLSKIEPKDLRNAMSFEKILEIKHPVTTELQLKTPTSKSSESILELTAKIPELNTTFLGVADFKLSDTTAERSQLEITDSDSQIQPENILEVKHFESVSETESVPGTHPFKAVLEPGKVTQDNNSKSISDVLCSGSNVENREKNLESKDQKTKDLDSPQFAAMVAKELKGSLAYEEIIDISDKSPRFLNIVKITDTGFNVSSVVPKTIEKCSETSQESLNVSDLQGTDTNMELVILKEKSLEVTTDVESSKQDSECIDIVELKSKNAIEPVHSKELPNTALTLNAQDLERNSVFLLTQNKTSEAALEPVSISECKSAKDIEQNLKSVVMAEGNTQESAVDQVILTQSKSAEIVPQLITEVKGSEATSESLCVANKKDLVVAPQISVTEQGSVKSLCRASEDKTELNQPEIMVLKDSRETVEPVHLAEKEDLKVGEHVTLEMKDSETALQSESIVKDKHLEISVQASSKGQNSETALKSSDLIKESEGSNLKDRKSEKISSKSKDKSKSGKKAKKSRSKSPSKSKKRKKKSRSRSTSRQVSSRRARSRSKNDSGSKKKHSTSHHKSRSKSVDKKEDKDSSLRSRRRRSRTSDRLKSRSRSADRRESPVRSRRRRSRSSDHRSRSRSVDKRESARRKRRLSRSSDNRKSRSRSVDRRETLTRSRRRRSRSSDRHKSRSRSVDKRETSVRTRRRRSQSSDHCKSRSKSRDRQESSIRTRRRQSRSSDRKSRSRSPDDKREFSVRTRRRRSRTPDTRKSRSRSIDRRDISGRARRRRSRSSDNRKSRSRSVDKRESSVRMRRRRSRSSDNRRSKSKSTDRRETSVRRKRRRSVSSDRKSRSKSVDKRDTSARSKRRRSRSSDNCKSRSKSVENIETSAKSKRRRSKSTDRKSRAKSVEKESSLKSRHRRSKSSDRPRSKSKSRSKSSERRKEKDSDGSRGNRSKYRSKSKSLEKTDGTECLEATLNNQEKSEQHKSKSRSRSKSIDKAEEKESLRRSRSKGSKSPESRSHRHRTVSRSRRNRSRSLTRRRSRSKSDHRSQSRSRTRSRSCSRRWRRTRSRSLSRQRSLSRKRHRRSRRNRSRSTDRRRRRSDSRESYRISLRLRSRSRTPARLRCSRSTGRRRSTSKSPDHRRSRSSSRSPKRLTDLDKAQLLEIAKANAAAMCAKAGVTLPPSLMPVIAPEKKEEKVTQKSAKETILELTEKCKKIAQSQEDDVIVNKPHVSDEEEEEHPFINHPFKLSEPKPIFFNLTTPTIKPAAPKNQVTLTKEFPVSSGSQHRKKEADSAYGEWVPVEKNKDENKDDVFPNPANLEPVDISSALNERTIAQKRLTENTFDLEAMCLLNRAQERIDAWAELNSIPGHFTGSTGAQVLSSEQLSNSGPQAWIKKDQFLRAAPVTGGMGAQLMRKMGWREGEGLGKNKEGNKEPILVDFKTDRKGLVAVGEKTQKRHGPFSTVKDLSGKHPVSALLEVCNKRRWSPPVFVLVNDNRPEYRKHFLFKVMVNGVEHKPSFVSPNKKHAKATAATVALQALGLVPKELLANATSFRSASHN